MPVSPQFVDYVLGQIEEAGEITHRRMFGGVGVYVDGTFCGIIGSSSRFYLRVGPGNLEGFIAEGMAKFPGGKGKGMPYYEVPESVVEDPQTLGEWARAARDEARAAKAR